MVQKLTWAFHGIVSCANGLPSTMAILQAVSTKGILTEAKLEDFFHFDEGR